MQQSVSANGFCLFGKADGMRSVVATGACNNRYAVVYLFHSVSNRCNVFFIRHGRSFPRGAADNNAVGLVFNLEFKQFAQFVCS